MGFTDRVLLALGEPAESGLGAWIVVVAHQGVLRALEHHFGITLALRPGYGCMLNTVHLAGSRSGGGQASRYRRNPL
jgi:hypothetical protein